MTAQQLNMLTQMITQNHQSTQSTKNNNDDDNTFKNMLDDKKQENSSVKDESVKDETVKVEDTENEIQTSDKEDIASKQALLANLLFAQSTTPIQNEMSQQNTNISAEQIIQPVVQNQMVENVQNIQNMSDNMNNIQNMSDAQSMNNVQTQQVDISAETQDTNEFIVKPEVKSQVEVEQSEISQPKTEIVDKTAKNTESGDSTQNMMGNKTSQTDTEQLQSTQTEVQVETPLFQNVENTPVKVGETTPVLDTQSPNVEQDLQDIIKYNLKADGDKIEIQLNPSNLGKITIELVQKDGSMSVLVTAENSKTLSLLAQHAGGIETMMQERLAQPVHVFIEQQQQQFNDGQNHNNQQNQNNQNNQNNKPSKDEQQSFIDQLRLGLYQLG